MDKPIINKVAQSPIISIDLRDFYPEKNEYELLDIADFLYERLILKEKDFRQALKTLDYTRFQNKYTGIFCSEEVIIPQWAYLLIITHLTPYTTKIFYGNEKQLIQKIMWHKVQNLNTEIYQNKPVVIKGCSNVEIHIEVYMHLTQKLMPIARSIMYGEPCSNVPLFKRKT
mgnify:CR=1 FL=1